MLILIIVCLGTSMSNSYNEMILETPYKEEAIDDQYIDNIDMDNILHIIAGNTTSAPNLPPWKRQMKTTSWPFLL